MIVAKPGGGSGSSACGETKQATPMAGQSDCGWGEKTRTAAAAATAKAVGTENNQLKAAAKETAMAELAMEAAVATVTMTTID